MRAFWVFVFFISSTVLAINPQRGNWIGSGGVGLSLSPTLILFSPSLEYAYEPDLYFGGLTQMGFGSGGVLFTIAGSTRYIFARRGRVFPCVEGALGLTMGSAVFDQALGVQLMAGFGVDYEIDRTTSIGSMIRFNFAPPLKSMFITWPMLIGRFLL